MSTPTDPGSYDDRSDEPARHHRASGSHEQTPEPEPSRGSSALDDLFSSEPAYPPYEPEPEPAPEYNGNGRLGGDHSYPTGPAYAYPPPPSYDPPAPGTPASYDPPTSPAPYDPPTPPIPYEPPGPQDLYDTPPRYDLPSSYDAAPSYETAPSYDPAPSYNGAPTYQAPATYDTPATYETPTTYDPAHPAPEAPSFDPAPAAAVPGAGPVIAAPPVAPPEPEFTYQGAPDDGRPPKVSIVLPCFNEQDHVLLELERISRAMDDSGMPYELLAVDDASTDATLARLRLAAPKLPRMKVVPFSRNGGAGTVRRIGSQQARGEIVVWTDADMSYPNERIPELVAILDANPLIDQVVGARTSEEGTYKFIRVPAKWAIRKLAERLTSSKIPDLNSGLRAFRREVALPYLRLLPPGFSCVTTITVAFLSNQHDVQYIPIDYAKRAGVSKFKFVRDAYRYILQVLRMVMYFNPLKVLMPVALFLLGLGIAKGIYDMVVHPFYFAINTVLIFVTGLIIASLALLADLIVRSRGDT